MKNLFLFIMLIQIGTAVGQDKALFLPENLVGEWVRVVEVPVPQTNYVEKDSIIYRIGKDQVVDSISYMETPMNIMAFNAEGKYTRSSVYGVIYRPYRGYYGKYEYDSRLDVSYIRFILLRRDRTQDEIRFSYTRDYPADTIVVTIGSESFGLKRKGL